MPVTPSLGMSHTTGASSSLMQSTDFYDAALHTQKKFYYFAIVNNLVCRGLFAINMSVGWLNLFFTDGLVAFLAVAEVYRRVIWNLIRVENEHLNNVDGFRATTGDVPLPFQYISAHDLQAEADKGEEEKDELDKTIKKVDTNEPTGDINKNGNDRHSHVNIARTLHRSISTNNDEQDITASADQKQRQQLQISMKPRRKSRVVVHIQPYSPQGIESGQDLLDIAEETIVDRQQSRRAQVMDTHVRPGAPSATKSSPPLTPESPRLLSITAHRSDSCSDGPVLSTDA